MGVCVNPGIDKFRISLNSKFYVDKSHLIAKTNDLIGTEERFICVSRPRRFGKTMAANMLAAYYGFGIDSNRLFENLKIANHPSYEEHLNEYHVIMLNIHEFLSKERLKRKKEAEKEEEKEKPLVASIIDKLERKVTQELYKAHPEIEYDDISDFIQVLTDVYNATNKPFVFLIDEWDCIFREYRDDEVGQEIYLDFLKFLFKDQPYIGLAYMTGILPIKKYNTESALNMFDEYSMTQPSQFLDYFGFKVSEVEALAKENNVDFEEIKRWYNGYFVELGHPIYNPTSVTKCLRRREFASYWSKTGTYESLKGYIQMNFDGLKDKITLMLAGKSVVVDTGSFANDMTTFGSADDVLTLLVHLGYLTYNFEEATVRIPNEEIKAEFVVAIKSLKWEHVMIALDQSDQLLQAIWESNPEIVAEGIQKVHEQNTSILSYNDENSLACVISLALYTANQYYIPFRELPSGKGYADIVFIPRKKYSDKPALLVELKWDQTASGAIAQIKDRNYTSALDEYHGNLLLVGINYEKVTKEHICKIESFKI